MKTLNYFLRMRLTDRQYNALEQLATERKVKQCVIVRELIDQYIAEPGKAPGKVGANNE